MLDGIIPSWYDPINYFVQSSLHLSRIQQETQVFQHYTEYDFYNVCACVFFVVSYGSHPVIIKDVLRL